MIGRALDAGTPARWAAGDEVYGADTALRKDLAARGLGYVLAVARSHLFTTGIGPRRAIDLAVRLPESCWQRLSAGTGAKGERWYDWALVEVSDPAVTKDSGPDWLLIRRRISDGEYAFYRAHAHRRIPNAERAGQGTVLASPAFERIAHPSADADGRRTPALRFGDPRVQALAGALCQTLLAATGITNKSLRALMTGLLHAPYTPGQMTYDLRRLRLTGLIRRIEHTNRYVLTPDGIKVAVFYTKLHNRLLRPLLAADQPQAPAELRAALRTIDQHIEDYITCARLSQGRVKT